MREEVGKRREQDRGNPATSRREPRTSGATRSAGRRIALPQEGSQDNKARRQTPPHPVTNETFLKGSAHLPETAGKSSTALLCLVLPCDKLETVPLREI